MQAPVPLGGRGFPADGEGRCANQVGDGRPGARTDKSRSAAGFGGGERCGSRAGVVSRCGVGHGDSSRARTRTSPPRQESGEPSPATLARPSAPTAG